MTGCFEHPKPNPLEGMSEEQKEYEALQLLGLVDKLTRFVLLFIYEYNNQFVFGTMFMIYLIILGKV